MSHSGQTASVRERRAAFTIFLIVWIILCLETGCSRKTENRRADPPPTLPPPHFSVQSGLFTSNIQVRLISGSPSAVIRYTLDGSEPTTSARKYSNPIEISESTLLKAKVYDAHSSNSPVARRSYVLVNSDLAGFDSNLPLVIVHSFHQTIPHEQKAMVYARFMEAKTGRTGLLSPADFDGIGELNVRGHTSLRYPKHSYHFKAQDEAHNPLKVPIFGFPKDSDWVLYAPYPDKTLMRDVLAYELSNQMGRYAPRTKFVEVFLNESGGKLSRRDYLGVFVFEEKIKRGKNRVDLEKLTPQDNTEPTVSGGYIFKKDHMDRVDFGKTNPGGYPMGGGGRGYSGGGYLSGPGGFPGNPDGFLRREGRSFRQNDGFFQNFSGLFSSGPPQGFNSGHGNHFFFVEPKPEELTPAQRTWLTRYVNKCEEVLYGNNFKDPKTGYAAYLDADSFVDYHLLVEITKNIDGFRFSTFYSKDRGEKIKMGPIWDWNLSLGQASGKQGYLPEYWYWPQLDDQQYSWFRRLFEDADFGQRYVDRWGELRTNQFVVSKIHGRIDELAALLEEAQARNFQKWRILGRSVYPNNYIGRTYQDEVNYIKQWIQKRIEWIDQQFLIAPSFSFNPQESNQPLALSMRAPEGRIYYTTDGTDPRAPGGAVAPAAKVFEAPIPLSGARIVFCRASKDSRWSPPAISRFGTGKTESAFE